MYVWVSVCVCERENECDRAHVYPYRGQKRALTLLILELQAIVSHLQWMQGAELRSTARAESTLNHQAISAPSFPSSSLLLLFSSLLSFDRISCRPWTCKIPQGVTDLILLPLPPGLRWLMMVCTSWFGMMVCTSWVGVMVCTSWVGMIDRRAPPYPGIWCWGSDLGPRAHKGSALSSWLCGWSICGLRKASQEQEVREV